MDDNFTRVDNTISAKKFALLLTVVAVSLTGTFVILTYDSIGPIDPPDLNLTQSDTP